MTEPVREKDVQSLRTAIVCVGLSGVFLALFVWLASKGGVPWAAVISSALTGLVVAALGLWRGPSARLSRPGRMLAYWALSALLVLEVMVPLNYVGSQRHAQWDWTESKNRSLSDQTLKVLEGIDQPVRISTFFVPESMGPQEQAAYNLMKDLLEQYRRHNDKLVIRHLNPARDTEETVATMARLKIEDPRDLASWVFFETDKTRKDVPVGALFQPLPDAEANEQVRPDQIGFMGEQLFTAALLDVTEAKHKELWFLTSHGELSPERDLYDLAGDLRRLSYRVQKFDTLADGVPDNCSVLVIVRPKPQIPFNDRELASLGRYLAEGGKLFIGVNGGGFCGFEPLLSDFGIEMGRDYIIDETSGRAQLTVGVHVSGWSEIVRNLRDFPLSFKAARTVGAAESLPGAIAPPRKQAYNLLSTGRNCWSTADVESVEQGRNIRFDPRTDKRGELPVAAYYEQPDRDPSGALLPKDRPRTRIVAVGSGDFLVGRKWLPNELFFLNSVNWLAERENLISIPPKRFDYRPLDKLGPPEASFVFWLTTVIMPALVLVIGCVIWLVRRAL